MHKFVLKSALLFAGSMFASTAMAQSNTMPPPPSNTETADEVQAPDGSDAFGFEPYVAVLGGGYADFDPDNGVLANRGRFEGALVEGLVGANIPLGPLFVGAEGSVAKGVDGAIDWQYGVAGRIGVRAGESGLIYGKAGYEWVNFTDETLVGSGDFGTEVYGMGVEFGPRDIGLGGVTGESGVRIRLEATTRDFDSIRPMAGLVFHF